MTSLKNLKVKWGGGAHKSHFLNFTLFDLLFFEQYSVKINNKVRNHEVCMKKAFTLAEVLITLGIIGIVAAMTMPTLIHNHNKKVIETRLKKFYSSINQAIIMSELENGDKKDWQLYYLNAPECTADTHSKECLRLVYDKYFKKYLKTTKAKWIDSSSSFVVYFADGSVARLGYGGRDWLFCINDRITKGGHWSNAVGEKCFMFGFYPTFKRNLPADEYLYNKGVEPFIRNDWDGTYEGLKTHPYNYTKLIQLNNWEIPDDYPLKI